LELNERDSPEIVRLNVLKSNKNIARLKFVTY